MILLPYLEEFVKTRVKKAHYLVEFVNNLVTKISTSRRSCNESGDKKPKSGHSWHLGKNIFIANLIFFN